MKTSGGAHVISLLHDDALVVRVSDPLLAMTNAWLPSHVERMISPAAPVRAVIDVVDVHELPASADESSESPLVLFAGVRARATDDERISLRGSSAVRGEIVLGETRARIAVPRIEVTSEPTTDVRTHPHSAAGELYSMLTLSAAFLIGRLGSALVHAGAVVDPDGRAWLLAGDTHAGKTTTCVSLVDAGWSFLADDQVVLRHDDAGEIIAEGWPRHAHLDEGWSSAVVTGSRGAVDMRARWGERWMRRAPLGGVLFPSVAADQPTHVAELHAATSFSGLLRQSPWLIADRGAAASVMALLQCAAERPAFALSLGRDSYARGDVLAARLAPAVSGRRG